MMTKFNFFKTKYLSFYKCDAIGYIWIKIFNLNLSFKHINKYDFSNEKIKGIIIGYWVINKI